MPTFSHRSARVFLGFLAATGRLVARSPLIGLSASSPALLSAADPAPDHLYGLLLAAGGRADGDLHRHGAGAATYTGFSRFNAESAVATVVVLSVTRELGPVIAGADGRRPGRRGDGGRDRHHARHRPDRRADDAVDRPVHAIWCCRASSPALITLPLLVARRRHHRRVRRLPRQHLQARLQRAELSRSARASTSRRRTSCPAWLRRPCSASSSR